MNDVIVDRGNIVNVNVGILGHVDSGKTSLVKALSTLLSTAALDKNPQSQQRGITLDLGFSAFTLPMPDHLRESAKPGNDLLQFTLVDCPGHASLIRTIIGGAQIIDMMILVVDANKGIQTQTAECIVIGEITTDKLIIVLNKCDLLPEAEREIQIAKMTGKLRKVFSTTKFSKSPIIPISASVGGEKVASIGLKCVTDKLMKKDGMAVSLSNTQGVTELVDLLRASIEIPRRNCLGPLYFAIDHCFSIKGHGTILTGTVLSGSVSLNSVIEVPHLQVQRKVKSMQMFRKAVRFAGQGDRVGLCVTNLDPTSIERSIAVTPGSIPLLSTVICMVKKVRFFRQTCMSNTKFHISIGHTTVAATVAFYGAEEIAALLATRWVAHLPPGVNKDPNSLVDGDDSQPSDGSELIDSSTESVPHHHHVDESPFQSSFSSRIGAHNTSNNETKLKIEADHAASKRRKLPNGDVKQSALNAVYHSGFPSLEYPWDVDFEYQHSLQGTDGIRYGHEPAQWAVLQFQRPVFCPIGSLIIGSRFDTFSTSIDKEMKDSSNRDAAPAQTSQCRLAFYGPIKESVALQDMQSIKVFSWKEKSAEVLKITDSRGGLCCELIGCNLVQEGGNMQSFIGMKIETERGHLGVITGPYGSGGSFKVKFGEAVPVCVGSKLVLRFKRYLHDKLKVMAQHGLDEYAQEKAAAIAALSPYIGEAALDVDDAKKSNRQKKAEKKAATAIRCLRQESASAALQSTSNTPQSCSSNVPENVPQTNARIVPQETTKAVPQIVPRGTAERAVMVALTKEQAATVAVRLTEVATVDYHSDHCLISSKDVNPASAEPAAATEECLPTAAHAALKAARVGVLDSFKQEPGTDFLIGIVSGAFRMEECIRYMAGAPVSALGAVCGTLVGPFAKLGKCKIRFLSTPNLSVGMSVEIDISSFTV